MVSTTASEVYVDYALNFQFSGDFSSSEAPQEGTQSGGGIRASWRARGYSFRFAPVHTKSVDFYTFPTLVNVLFDIYHMSKWVQVYHS